MVCAKETDKDIPGDDANKTCSVVIKLTDTTQKPSGSKAGLIIGIIAAVIVVLVGIVALLG